MRTTAPISITRHGYTYVRLPEPNREGRIVIDANVQGGSPCIEGTRIPAHSIAAYYNDNMNYICEAWNITEAQVEACLDYVNAPSRRP